MARVPQMELPLPNKLRGVASVGAMPSDPAPTLSTIAGRLATLPKAAAGRCKEVMDECLGFVSTERNDLLDCKPDFTLKHKRGKLRADVILQLASFSPQGAASNQAQPCSTIRRHRIKRLQKKVGVAMGELVLFVASHIASDGHVIAKETEHFPSSVRPSRIGIGSGGTATRPSVASSMDAPLL